MSHTSKQSCCCLAFHQYLCEKISGQEHTKLINVCLYQFCDKFVWRTFLQLFLQLVFTNLPLERLQKPPVSVSGSDQERTRERTVHEKDEQRYSDHVRNSRQVSLVPNSYTEHCWRPIRTMRLLHQLFFISTNELYQISSSFFIILVELDELNQIKISKHLTDLTRDQTQVTGRLIIALKCLLCLCWTVNGS